MREETKRALIELVSIGTAEAASRLLSKGSHSIVETLKQAYDSLRLENKRLQKENLLLRLDIGLNNITVRWMEQEVSQKQARIEHLQARVDKLQQMLLQVQRARGQPQLSAALSPQLPEDSLINQWLRILPDNPIILITGGQGAGKSALGYWLLEISKSRNRYIYNLPPRAAALLPQYIGITQDLGNVPPNSFVLVDEAYLALFARESQTRRSRQLLRMVSLARQRRLGLTFVAHESRHLDKNVLGPVNVLILEEPAHFQLALDRAVVGPYLRRAKAFFGTYRQDKRTVSYIAFAYKDFSGPLENPLPSFWSEDLSKAFASLANPVREQRSRSLSREEREERVIHLILECGWFYRAAAREVGVSPSTAHRWVRKLREG